jgi:hypothetical protein
MRHSWPADLTKPAARPARPLCMRPLILLAFGAISAFSQPVGFGVKGGVPLTDFFSTVQSLNGGYNSTTKRYIVGPTLELRLPAGFGIEVDALYRRFNYEGNNVLVDVFNSTTGNAWEFPLLVKYRFQGKLVRPYLDAGVAWNALAGLTQSISRGSSTLFPLAAASNNPVELNHTTTTGFVIGGGLDVHAAFLHVSPEICYTRWSSEQFANTAGTLVSNRNQAEFLLGITF